MLDDSDRRPNLADEFLHFGGLPPAAVDVLWQRAAFTGEQPRQAPGDELVDLLAASAGNGPALFRLGGALRDPGRIERLAADIDAAPFLDGLAHNPHTPRDLATSLRWQHGTELQQQRARSETTDDPGLAARHGAARRLAELLLDPATAARARTHIEACGDKVRHQVLDWLRREGHGGKADDLTAAWLGPDATIRLGADDIAAYLSPHNLEARLDIELYAAGDLDEAVPQAPALLSRLAARLTAPAAVYAYSFDSPAAQLLAAWSNTGLGSHLRWTLAFRRPPDGSVRHPNPQRHQPPPVDLQLARALGETGDALAALATDDPRTTTQDLIPALAQARPRMSALWLAGQCPHRPRPGEVLALAEALDGAARSALTEALMQPEAAAANAVDALPWAAEVAMELNLRPCLGAPVSLAVAAVLYDAALETLGTRSHAWTAAFALLENFDGAGRDWLAAAASVSA